MLALGFLISNHIDASLNDSYQKYNTATKIDNNAELFEYGLRTNIGNTFIYGDLVAVDPISIKDIRGAYAYIYKREEHYVRHSRVVTTRDSKGRTHTHIEYYWTWDAYRHWDWHCKKIAFLGHEFDYDTIELPYSKYFDTLYESHRVRFVYYVCDTKYIGTLYTNIANHTINNSTFYNAINIDTTIKRLESKSELIFFWIIWILIIGGLVFGFYYLENRWLE